MQIRFVAPTLTALDEIEGDCLVLTFFSDERPLRGLTGLVDWRLNGKLSRLLLRQFLDGHFQEAMLSTVSGRLSFGRLLLVGLGDRAEFDAQRFRDACLYTFEALARAQVGSFAMALPGRIGLDIGLRQAVDAWRDAVRAAFPGPAARDLVIHIAEPPEVQRELAEPMRDLEKLADRFAG
jgi:hypothetical protein